MQCNFEQIMQEREEKMPVEEPDPVEDPFHIPSRDDSVETELQRPKLHGMKPGRTMKNA
ncbi:MAG TPA: hypothetical protein VE954_27085 [Oligoflexus sp.]|uniref:hypothetical protein n=1 Tax=Oligoflexus sp. TaxID=1971216 RepID=UPI002D4578CB|nr:hypothetical protein [Oligoflexus sp.]HYX36789.1 hypothetical protein [Oligoflexus sp.]